MQHRNDHASLSWNTGIVFQRACGGSNVLMLYPGKKVLASKDAHLSLAARFRSTWPKPNNFTVRGKVRMQGFAIS